MSTQRKKYIVLGEEPDNPVQVSEACRKCVKSYNAKEKKSFPTVFITGR